MQRRVLHIGPHKTGSSFLQIEVFPRLSGITYYGGGDLAQFQRQRLAPSKNDAILWSTEAALGWPYPVCEPPRYESLLQICRDHRVTHVFAVKRPFPSWVQSVYFQYLNEGGTKSLPSWIDSNMTGLCVWREMFRVVREMVEREGIVFEVFSLADLKSDPRRTLRSLADFMGAEPPPAWEVGSGKANVSRRGAGTISIYRRLNQVWPARWLGALCPRVVNLPRFLIQGRRGIGGLLDALPGGDVTLGAEIEAMQWV